MINGYFVLLKYDMMANIFDFCELLDFLKSKENDNHTKKFRNLSKSNLLFSNILYNVC